MEPAEDPATPIVCHLFRIPGELRNAIYEYALTEGRALEVERRGSNGVLKCYKQPPAGNMYHHDTETFSKSLADVLLEVNQLRFVNKQLYAETRALELGYNSLAFGSIEDANLFLKDCAPSHQAHLRDLTVHCSNDPSSSLYDAAAMEFIIKFCNENSEANVRMKNACYNPSAPTSLIYMALHEVCDRGTQQLLHAIFTPECVERNLYSEWIKRQAAKANKVTPCPKNLRFFPCISVFDERVFRAAIPRFAGIHGSRVNGAIIGGEDGLVSIMKQVIEHGI